MPVTAQPQNLDTLYGVFHGDQVIDQNLNLGGVRIWLDSHDLFDSEEDARGFALKVKDHFDGVEVRKLSFTLTSEAVQGGKQ